MLLYVIAGHGAGDPGKCANGYQEAERVRALAQRIKDFGGDSVRLHPFSDNAYRSGALNGVSLPDGAQVVELHMDSSDGARGGHVVIKAGFSPDSHDEALASLMADVFPGRSELIVKRSDLANVNRAARRGIAYRLVENGFISSAEDVAVFNARMDDLARGYLAAFGIEGGEAPAKSEPSDAPSKAAGLDVDGYWGPATVKALQDALGTVADGIVSGQNASDMEAIGGKPSSAWRTGGGGSLMVRALQGKVGADADGYFGPKTCRKLQAYLGTVADGAISKPSACVKELQRRLNAGTF